MPYDTYQELVDSIEGYLHEDGLQGQIGDFILLFESIEGAKLRHPYGQVHNTAWTVSTAKQELPDDCANVRTFGYAGKKPMTQVPFEEIYSQQRTDIYAVLAGTDGTKETQTLILPTNAVEKPFDAEIVYIKKLGNVASATNWLYRQFPMIYLYGSLIQAQPYLDQDPRISTWNAFYQGALEAMETAARSIESGDIQRSSQRVRERI